MKDLNLSYFTMIMENGCSDKQNNQTH